MTVPLKEALVPKLLQGVPMWIPNQNIEKAFLFQESYSNIKCGTFEKGVRKKEVKKSLFILKKRVLQFYSVLN